MTGGTTLAEVARSLPTAHATRGRRGRARPGRLGEEVELQANTVAAAIADSLGGTYRLLHVPDDLGKEAMSTISMEPKIKELIELIRSARIVLHGIGTAEEMARRRGFPRVRRLLNEQEAVERPLVTTSTAREDRLYDEQRRDALRGPGDVELVVAVGGGRRRRRRPSGPFH